MLLTGTSNNQRGQTRLKMAGPLIFHGWRSRAKPGCLRSERREQRAAAFCSCKKPGQIYFLNNRCGRGWRVVAR
jgi:hypothetical protein